MQRWRAVERTSYARRKLRLLIIATWMLLHLIIVNMLMVLLLTLVLASVSNQLAVPRSTAKKKRTDSWNRFNYVLWLRAPSPWGTRVEQLQISHLFIVKWNFDSIEQMDMVYGSLQEWADISITEVNNDYGIKFNLTHDLDGYYTCPWQMYQRGCAGEQKKKAFICTAKHFKHSFLQAQFRILHHDIAFFSFIAFHMLIKMPGACRG